MARLPDFPLYSICRISSLMIRACSAGKRTSQIGSNNPSADARSLGSTIGDNSSHNGVINKNSLGASCPGGRVSFCANKAVGNHPSQDKNRQRQADPNNDVCADVLKIEKPGSFASRIHFNYPPGTTVRVDYCQWNTKPNAASTELIRNKARGKAQQEPDYSRLLCQFLVPSHMDVL